MNKSIKKGKKKYTTPALKFMNKKTSVIFIPPIRSVTMSIASFSDAKTVLITWIKPEILEVLQ